MALKSVCVHIQYSTAVLYRHGGGGIVPEGPESRHSSKLHKKKQCASDFTRLIYFLLYFYHLPSIFPSLCSLFFVSFSQPLRTVQQCSSVPISWIRKTSLAALTRSWCSTEVMRTERELAVFLTLMSRQECVSSFYMEINV